MINIKDCITNVVIKRLLTNKRVSYELVNRRLAHYKISITKDVFDNRIKEIITKEKIKINPKDIEIYPDKWTVEACAKYLNKLFVFGDNTKRQGMGGQAIIRNCPNSIGIATKVLPSGIPAAYFNDSNLISIRPIIDKDILEVKLKFFTGNYDKLVLAADGYGTGFAQLYNKAPLVFKYLCEKLKDEFNFDNANSIHKI